MHQQGTPACGTHYEKKHNIEKRRAGQHRPAISAGSIREQAVRGASLGLLSMEERAALAGGGLEFKSIPKQGTEIHAWFPLKWKTPSSESKKP